ncbi:bifunctional pyr operon transcriptional regulator/uracil phosphoribosyltransferase PyrR [Salinibacter altiplanensis]|uniref:bifunctional pyr operon transcriptional regulator/uracil phosphoribosyltransferase PyrR n=1 Tax=Salinibacter altiplanensis TaxID=1803181 RepID=UPI000C9F71BF|nr:bifunctional pyr operon transcriptional regulator/uracil phosphoribosyltransferase PyrR [Salinibacter altiplanensis]
MPSDDRIKAQLMTARDLGRTLDRMAQQVIERFDPMAPASPVDTFALVGMQTRGVHLARRLQRRIHTQTGQELPLGLLDVTMYRDDVRLRLDKPEIQATRIPFDVTDRELVLVDDVVFTGRTGRAALDALMDRGRPAAIQFLTIVDRQHRELPISVDIVGREVPTLPGEEVRVRVEEVDDEDGVWLVNVPVSERSTNDSR